MRNLIPAYNIIKKWEVSNPEKPPLKAYKDPVGFWTIGFGNRFHPDGREVKQGDVITLEQADSYLKGTVESFAKQVESLVKVEINDNQFCALVSFAYNVGLDIDNDNIAEGLGDSTLLKKLNAGDFEGAALEFPKWNKAGGKVLNGLVRRRADEMALFQAPQTVIIQDTEVNTVTIEDPVGDYEPPNWLINTLNTIWEMLVKFFTGEKPPEGGVIPDNPDTNAPVKKTISMGNGPRVSMERVKEVLESQGVDTSKVCLLGVRGYYLDTYGAKGKNDRGVYDDALIWWKVDSFYTFRGNTDPSSFRKGSGTGSKKGMALLKKGVWPGYYPGMHNGSVPHLAFRQGKPVTVIRDGSPDYEDTGMFGINIHRGGKNGTSSLGCQTVMPSDWDNFKSMGDEALKKYDQKEFVYCLVEETEDDVSN